jgi:hypothetical protein
MLPTTQGRVNAFAFPCSPMPVGAPGLDFETREARNPPSRSSPNRQSRVPHSCAVSPRMSGVARTPPYRFQLTTISGAPFMRSLTAHEWGSTDPHQLFRRQIFFEEAGLLRDAGKRNRLRLVSHFHHLALVVDGGPLRQSLAIRISGGRKVCPVR